MLLHSFVVVRLLWCGTASYGKVPFKETSLTSKTPLSSAALSNATLSDVGF